MDTLRVAIIEDEVIIAEDLRQTLQVEGYLVTGCYETGEAALQHILRDKPDLVMIDIRLKGAMNGIELASKLRNSLTVAVIYITASSDDKTYRLAKSTNPQAFLVKPFNSRSLLAAVDLALDNFLATKVDPQKNTVDGLHPGLLPGCIFIRVNGKHRKICLCDVLFVEADGSYINIVTSSGRYTLSQNLGDFQRKMHLTQFVRVHRSYIVNVERVDSFDESFIYIGQNQIPLSKSYRTEFQGLLNAI